MVEVWVVGVTLQLKHMLLICWHSLIDSVITNLIVWRFHNLHILPTPMPLLRPLRLHDLILHRETLRGVTPRLRMLLLSIDCTTGALLDLYH